MYVFIFAFVLTFYFATPILSFDRILSATKTTQILISLNATFNGTLRPSHYLLLWPTQVATLLYALSTLLAKWKGMLPKAVKVIGGTRLIDICKYRVGFRRCRTFF